MGDLPVDLYTQLMSRIALARDEAVVSVPHDVLRDERFSHPFFWAAFDFIGDWR